MEEEKEVVVVEKEKTTAGRKEEDPLNHKALVAFVLCCVAVSVSPIWIPGGIASLVLGIIARKFSNEAEGVRDNPYRVFNRIARPVSIVCIVLGAIFISLYFIVLFTKNIKY